MVAVSALLGVTTGREHLSADARPASSGVLAFDVRRIATVLWLATAIVLGLGILREVFVHIYGKETVLKDLRHFALDAEHCLPAWYESMVMAVAAGLLVVLAKLAKSHDPRNRAHWAFLAVIFILMSIDESVSFHEVSIKPLRDAFNLSGFFYFSWVIIAAPLLLVLAIMFIPFMLRLPRHIAGRFFVAGALFVGGALGLELVGGYYASIGGFDYLPYKIAASCEECLEIIGMTLFVTSLLKHLAETAPILHVSMKDGA